MTTEGLKEARKQRRSLAGKIKRRKGTIAMLEGEVWSMQRMVMHLDDDIRTLLVAETNAKREARDAKVS